MCAAEGQSNEEQFSHTDCIYTFSVYKNSNHIQSMNFIEPGSLGTKAEFCGAFYHTPKSPTGVYHCLDEHNCLVAVEAKQKQSNWWVQPKTVVAVVKYEGKERSESFEAMYTNCYKRRVHAEEFFMVDITKETYGNEDLTKAILAKKIRKITMYITLQPCHFSIEGTDGTKENWSCCNKLLGLLNESLEGVKLCIKPTHICKANYGYGKRATYNKLIKNAKIGIKVLMEAGVEFSRMERDDWIYLADKFGIKFGVEIDPRRIKLDKKIGTFLHNLQKRTQGDIEDEFEIASKKFMNDDGVEGLKSLGIQEGKKLEEEGGGEEQEEMLEKKKEEKKGEK